MDIDEPLIDSAPLAREWSRSHCRIDSASGETCAWSHGFWQYLRLLGLAGTPERQADFYREAVSRLAGEPVRVLVCGSADYAMLAHLLASPRAGALQIAVIDWCETPLMLNRWYARRVSQDVETVRGDILGWSPEQRFDAICTHSFLGQVPPTRRKALVRRWASLLRPRGRVITVNRVRQGADSEERRGYTAEQAAQIIDVVGRASATISSWGADPAELLRDAGVYARKHGSWPVGSLNDLRLLFESAGFALEHLELSGMHGGPPKDALPMHAGGPGYAEIIALRR